MISPFKAVIGGAYKTVENRLLAAIHLRFGLPPALPADLVAIIKTADHGAAFLEATVLAGFGVTEARRFFGPRPPLPATVEKDYLTPWPARPPSAAFSSASRRSSKTDPRDVPQPQDDAMIHVCSLSRLHDTVAETGARHVVSLLASEDHLTRPPGVAADDHLWLQFHDIGEPRDGHIHPESEHVERLIAFARRWRARAPLVVHCYAGVSRSTAAAFVAVCAFNPASDELAVARRCAARRRPRRRISASSGSPTRARTRRPDGRGRHRDRPGHAR